MSRFFRQAWLLIIGALASTILGWLLFDQIERERQRQEALAAQRKALVVMPPTPPMPQPQDVEAIRPPQPAPPVLKKAISPKPEPKPPVAKAKPSSRSDDLTQIKGIGPAYARALNEAGIHSFSDLATQKPAELIKQLNSRVSVERVRDWIKQARQLSSGENER